MAFGKNTVAGIIAPVAKIVRQLEELNVTKSKEAEEHQKKADEAIKAKDSAIAAEAQASTIALKLKDFFSL